MVLRERPPHTHDLQGARVDQDHGELDDLVLELGRVVFLAGGLVVHHADVVVVGVRGAAVRHRRHQLLLLVVALQPLLHHVLHASVWFEEHEEDRFEVEFRVGLLIKFLIVI